MRLLSIPAVLRRKLTKFLSTIRGQILLITASFMILFGIIVGFISYHYITQTLEKSLIHSSETKLSFLCTSVDNNVSNVTDFIRSCQTNKKVMAFVSETSTEEDNQARSEARDMVSELYLSNSSLSSQLIRVVILSNFRDDIVQIVESSNSSVKVSKTAVMSLPYFETLHTHSGTAAAGIEADSFFTSRKVYMLPYLYILEHPYKAQENGYIFVEMSTNVLLDAVQNYQPEENASLYFHIGDASYVYEDGALLASETDFEILEELSDEALDAKTHAFLVKKGNESEKYILITRALSTENWIVAECLSRSDLYEMISNAYLMILLAIVIGISILGYILYKVLSNTINLPVSLLLARIEWIKTGDFSRDPSTEWDHELGEIGKNINNLAENIHNLMEQKIADEKEKRDYEYRMLQSQINPHFLYNTLNSIKWMATVQGATGISEMTTSLSRLLKDISKGATNLVTIEHEFSLIRDYFTIQQYRYGGTITMTIDYEKESLLQCQILKFTLQPIVENAIFHGIEPKGTAGSIQIRLYQDYNTDVHIDVTDDGIGIEASLMESLLKEDGQATSSGAFFREIGLANVHKRIRYEFGEKYGLSIQSEPGVFTTVSILLPAKKRKG